MSSITLLVFNKRVQLGPNSINKTEFPRKYLSMHVNKKHKNQKKNLNNDTINRIN